MDYEPFFILILTFIYLPTILFVFYQVGHETADKNAYNWGMKLVWLMLAMVILLPLIPVIYYAISK